MTNRLQSPDSYVDNPSTPIPPGSYPVSHQLSQQARSSSVPYRPSSAGAQCNPTDNIFDGAAQNEANTSKRRTRLANLMCTPPRRSHSTLSQEIFSSVNFRISSSSPASFLPSTDGSICSTTMPATRSNMSRVWTGRSTIPAKPSLSTSTSSSSEWTDDDKFLTLRPADDKEDKRLISPSPGCDRYATAEKLPGLSSPLQPAPTSPTKSSRFTPATTFSSIFKTSSSSVSKPNGSKPLTPRPARFLALCKSKKPFRSSSVTPALPPEKNEENKENLAPRAFSTPITDSDMPALVQLSPLSPNVELLRGSARHRHRVQLAVEDENPFGDLASGSGSDGEEEEEGQGEGMGTGSDGDDEGAFTMAPTTAAVGAMY